MLALNDIKHAIEVLGKSKFMHDKCLITLQIEFPIFLRQMQLIGLVISEIRNGCLLKANEVLRQTFPWRSEEGVVEVLGVLDLLVRSVTKKHSSQLNNIIK